MDRVRSNESGDNEIYVQAFPPNGRGIRISGAGGTELGWRRDGKESSTSRPEEA